MSIERIDYSALNEVREMLEGEFAELVGAYEADTTGKLSALMAKDPGKDSESIRKLVHSLKGASINLGLLQLGDDCKALEYQARDGLIQNYRDQLDKIKTETDFALSELSRLI